MRKFISLDVLRSVHMAQIELAYKSSTTRGVARSTLLIPLAFGGLGQQIVRRFAMVLLSHVAAIPEGLKEAHHAMGFNSG